MKVKQTELEITSKGEFDVINITEKTQEIVSRFEMKEGLANIFVPGSTGAVTTMEYEPGLLRDLPNALEKLAPRNAHYEHEEMWHDGNGHSHVRASILGPSMTVPISSGRLKLGTWQQLVFVELDIRPRNRNLVVTCMGD